MIPNRRQLTPAQRSAKIERDRRRRRERNMEFERLQKEERELQALTVAQRNEITSLKDVMESSTTWFQNSGIPQISSVNRSENCIGRIWD